jgi:hypothetical protein
MRREVAVVSITYLLIQWGFRRIARHWTLVLTLRFWRWSPTSSTVRCVGVRIGINFARCVSCCLFAWRGCACTGDSRNEDEHRQRDGNDSFNHQFHNHNE